MPPECQMTTDYIAEMLERIPDKLLTLDAWHRARGGRMVSFAGYQMPVQYEGVMAEHLWTRENAGLFDVSHMGQVLLTGEDPDGALETVVPGEIAKLPVNRMRYSLLLGEDGGVLDDLMITRRERDLYLVVNGACKYDDLAYMRETFPDEVVITLLDERALFALQGPKAGEALASLIPDVASLYFMQAGAFTLDDMSLWISRSGYTGEDGFEISVDCDHAAALADRLCAIDSVKPIGLGARDSLRLEAGLPLYGHDLDEDTSPIEGDLGFAISKRRRAEGGFAGAERVLGELTGGAPRKRVGLAVEGRQPVREGAELFAGDRLVGKVTSGGFAPSLGAPIAMGMVTAAHAAIGTALEAEVRGKRIAVTVAAMPFVPHRYHRPTAA
ncbi:glycine cleavage system protein T [Blastomonas fulva]|uniref:aminomethyltransferase n=2 Tax=Sphingomonadaceae TaxID=41297 RepID=A0ABM6MCD6_9SPHN|nr:glycine cleavage system protein T [Blastomonas fulva]